MEPGEVIGTTSPVNAVLRSRPDGISGLSSLSLPELGTKTSHSRNLFSPGPATVLSPVTHLALNMNNLAGLGRYYYSRIECINITCLDMSGRFSHPTLFASNGHSFFYFYFLQFLPFKRSFDKMCFSVHFSLTATVIPRKGKGVSPWRKIHPLPQTPHLMLVSPLN